MGMGCCLGRGMLYPLIPVALEGQPIGLPALERSVSVELLLELLLSCWLLRRWRPCWLHLYLRTASVFVLGGAPEGNGGSCGPLE